MANESGRVLVATGLSSAIGEALQSQLDRTWNIIGVGRRAPARGTWVEADFRMDAARWVPALATVVERQGHVEGFLHLAGLVFSDDTAGVTRDEWDSQLAVNLTAAFVLGQTVRPWLQSGSSVVLVGSVDARLASVAGPAPVYGAAKAALFGLMRQWAAEWGPQGIRVNAVAPGALAAGNGPQGPGASAATGGRTALGRLGRPEEVAAAIRFLLEGDSSYVTGVWLAVDGGLNLRY
ncbi:MAG: SDR family oxidoreductase [Thermaerobacter sp.]|nr:SDR family oxidoreductase [Thermaerobacter sp.]